MLYLFLSWKKKRRQKKEKARILYTFRKQLGAATGLRGLWHEGARENKWKIGVHITFLFLWSNAWRKIFPDFISHVGKVCEVRAASMVEVRSLRCPCFYLSTTPGSRGKLSENWHGSMTHKACPPALTWTKEITLYKGSTTFQSSITAGTKTSNAWAYGWH